MVNCSLKRNKSASLGTPSRAIRTVLWATSGEQPHHHRAEGEVSPFQSMELLLQLYIAFSRRVSVYIFYRKKTVQAMAILQYVYAYN